MDILYYSNYCKHSQKIVQTLVKHNLNTKISFICIDKRKRDPRDNQMYIELEDGKKVILPPNIQHVPSLLLIKNNYQVIYGDKIITYFHSDMKESSSEIVKMNGEPMGYELNQSVGGTNIISEKFTSYNMTAEDLGSKSKSNKRNMYNYVTIDQNVFIETPPENYKPDKISSDITVDGLQQKRIDEMDKTI
tara:strand:+ start:7613 stop:8185 length:573 start_codon:yes stop_codon:yes gene_type:complete